MTKKLTASRWVAAAVTLAAAVSGACSSKSAQSAGPARASAVPVVVTTVQQKTVPVQLKVIGRVETLSSVQLKPQVTGQILSVHFEPGKDVKKGDLLFRIDPKPFVAALRQAEANLARNQALLDNARAQAKRYQQLAEQGIVSAQQAEQLTSSADALEAAVRSDRAAVDQERLLVDYCDVFSPIDGRTGALMVFPGTVVKANDVPVLVVINQIHPVYVEFSAPEQHLAAIQREFARNRMLAEAALPDDPRTVMGALSFVDNTVDRTTGTIRLRATFANSENKLWPGQYVNVTLTISQQTDALVVPSAVVQSGQTGTYVFVVTDKEQVEMRPVTVARTMEKESVIGSGLKAGETVVLDGQLALVPGAKINIKARQ